MRPTSGSPGSQESYAQLTTALATSRALQTEILPRADTVLKSAEVRYAAGGSKSERHFARAPRLGCRPTHLSRIPLRRDAGMEHGALTGWHELTHGDFSGSGLSLMPEGMENAVTVEQMADLLAFLLLPP